MRFRRSMVRSVLLLCAAIFAMGAAGCANNTDAADPDPHYYKGKQFTHKRSE